MSDQRLVVTVKEQIVWLEQFYTDKARYPSHEEFYSRYPKENPTDSTRSNYQTNDFDRPPQDAQGFSLNYKLHHQNLAGAPGRQAHTDFIAFYSHTQVSECSRWKEITNFVPRMDGAVKSKSGNDFWDIQANLESGTINFVEGPLVGQALLKDLKQPRFLSPYDGNWYDENDLVLTNGNDILKYRWDPETQSLGKPEKIGSVPTGCPVEAI